LRDPEAGAEVAAEVGAEVGEIGGAEVGAGVEDPVVDEPPDPPATINLLIVSPMPGTGVPFQSEMIEGKAHPCTYQAQAVQWIPRDSA
jgi:hypothetical protein